ncbi:hypothetical protein VE03_07653 [Pseudogymnoascus sp. 23342-1-I1]|nr:hypothetical protein VE03_07653 [Pseudogymnoascus sp. 23342-1-I1]
MADGPKHEHLESNSGVAPRLQSNAADDLERFRGRIHDKMTSTDLSDICETFYQTFRQSLSLGQVSAADLAESMLELPLLIRNNAVSKDVEQALCISFYQATWGGITACKVLGPAEIDPKVLGIFLSQLPRIPVHMSSALIADILRSITDEQKHELKEQIYAIGRFLFLPRTSIPHPGKISQSTKVANLKYSPPKKALFGIDGMKDIVGTLMETFGLYAPEKQAEEEICHLVRLSTAYAIRAFFSHNDKSMETLVREGQDLRTTWLKLVARGPSASEDLLVQACSIIRREYQRHNTTITLPRLRQHVLCDVLFEYWASRMPNTSIMKAHAAFKATFPDLHRPHNSIVFLCLALKEQSIPWHGKVGCFLRMLRRIRVDGNSLYYCLKRLEDAKIYLDAPTLSDEMTALCRINVRHAARLQYLYSRVRPEIFAIPLEHFPDLAVTMVHDQSCNPRVIFNLFGGFRVWKEARTNNARIRLVEQMALEFSRASFISNRVALRNVAWCIRYLSQYQVPISTVIVRALVNLGIEGDIIEKGSISRGKLDWVLSIVKRAKGEVVAERMRAVLVTALYQERGRQVREYGWKCLGPID